MYEMSLRFVGWIFIGYLNEMIWFLWKLYFFIVVIYCCYEFLCFFLLFYIYDIFIDYGDVFIVFCIFDFCFLVIRLMNCGLEYYVIC